MLSVSRLDVAYGQSQVLWDVDLDVRAGELVCLMGRNGVGKTTLLKTAMGLLPARRGRVSFDGTEITGWSPDRRARAGIGYVPQGREIFPRLTVEEALRRIKRELGLAILLVEQYLDFAERLADKYVIMAKGAVVASGAARDLRVETVRRHLAV